MIDRLGTILSTKEEEELRIAGSKNKKGKEYLIIKLRENFMAYGLLNTKSSFVKKSIDSAQRPQ